MNFVTYITVPLSTTRATAVVTRVQLMRGIITAISLRQMSGTANKTQVLIQHDGGQVFPGVPESFQMPGSSAQMFPDFIKLDQVNPTVDVVAWNTDSAATGIEVVFTVINSEDFNQANGNTPVLPCT